MKARKLQPSFEVFDGTIFEVEKYDDWSKMMIAIRDSDSVAEVKEKLAKKGVEYKIHKVTRNFYCTGIEEEE